MKEQVFNPDNIWWLYSPRENKHWYVKCPSRSGAKIFLCSAQGPGVPASYGPFESQQVTADQVPQGYTVLEAWFYSANDPRNYDAKPGAAPVEPTE